MSQNSTSRLLRELPERRAKIEEKNRQQESMRL
jgi:hypothetical protein